MTHFIRKIWKGPHYSSPFHGTESFHVSPYYLVEASPWPLLMGGAAFMMLGGLTFYMHGNSPMLLWFGLLTVLFIMMRWFRDIICEATYMGYHTKPVETGLRVGMMLFIVSEIMFFFSFFWAYFHSALVPVYGSWPPVGILPMNPYEMPLTNTIILLSSGVTVTYAHHSIIMKNRNDCLIALQLTCTLGILFTLLQLYEYYNATFTISDGVYGSCFFVATGFHGLHVIIGSTFLLVCLFRAWKHHFSSNHHFGFEAAAWYWHFVDVVWLFLYMCIYWWG
uniref:Cytochrome c oxidase subunit 3 n=1 Tax=Siphonodentalium lobatum TaxID=203167 RepID=Q6VEH3_9MOLL|nr:cytochrome c oxidase subunit III [Siphonodentalium lobatum]AAP91675.1 cytochrome c oxidase subunit III [Siphonodentalium lobatum]